MNPATFNYLLEQLEEIQDKLDFNPFNARASIEYVRLLDKICYFEEFLDE